MDFFRTPGGSLDGAEKVRFDEIQDLIGNSTTDFLIKPDVGNNKRVVEAICKDLDSNRAHSKLIKDVMLILRRKLGDSNSKVVFLTLFLIETLVIRCGDKFHALINEESFISQMDKVVRKYNSSSSSADSREVAGLALDLVQIWGESFRPYESKYPNIVKLYTSLRRENCFPFKPRHDSSRNPDFSVRSQSVSPRGRQVDHDAEEREDAMLQAAIAASMLGLISPNDLPPQLTSGRAESAAQQQRNGGAAQQRRGSSSKLAPLMSSLTFNIGIASDIIEAANSLAEIRTEETTGEVISQISAFLGLLQKEIESRLIGSGEGLEELFRLNDAGQLVVSVYNAIMGNRMPLVDAKAKIKSNRLQIEPEAPKTATSSGTDSKLLDFLSDSPTGKPPAKDGDSNSNNSNNSGSFDFFNSSPGSAAAIQSTPIVDSANKKVLSPPPNAIRKPSITALSPPSSSYNSNNSSWIAPSFASSNNQSAPAQGVDPFASVSPTIDLFSEPSHSTSAAAAPSNPLLAVAPINPLLYSNNNTSTAASKFDPFASTSNANFDPFASTSNAKFDPFASSNSSNVDLFLGDNNTAAPPPKPFQNQPYVMTGMSNALPFQQNSNNNASLYSMPPPPVPPPPSIMMTATPSPSHNFMHQVPMQQQQQQQTYSYPNNMNGMPNVGASNNNTTGYGNNQFPAAPTTMPQQQPQQPQQQQQQQGNDSNNPFDFF